MELDAFITSKPLDPGLQALIDYYYFHESLVEEGSYNFVFYPHTHNALTVYEQSCLEATARGVEIQPWNDGYYICYTSQQSKALRVAIHRPFRKLGVVFKPLGFNHFIDGKLSELIAEKHGWANMNEVLLPAMEGLLRQVFRNSDVEAKTKLLDAHFAAAKKPFKEPKLLQAIALIEAEPGGAGVEDLAQQLGISRRTLARIFSDHCRCSPKAYMDVVRFRRALHRYMNSSEKLRLTDVAYDADFYDQSEFIRHFKKLTGYNPRKELQSIFQISAQATFWKRD